MQADVPVHLLPKPGDVVERHGTVGGLVEQGVKQDVLLSPDDAVRLGLHLVEELLRRGHRLLRYGGKGDAQDVRLQGGEHLVDLARLPGAQPRDHGPAPAAEIDQPLRLQQAERLAQRDGTDLQAFREQALMQGLAVRQQAAIDGLPKDVGDVVGGRVVLEVNGNEPFQGAIGGLRFHGFRFHGFHVLSRGDRAVRE